MSPPSVSARLADVRTDGQLLVEPTEDHASQLEAFVAAAEEGVRHGEAAVSRAIDACVSRRGAGRDQPRRLAYTGNPTFEASPATMLFGAVLTTPAAPEALLAAVRHTASL